MLDRLNGVPARTRVTKEIAMSLPSYAVLFRGYWACPCLAEWLPVLEAELQRRGILTGPLHIYQLIGDAAASGNTHKDGGAADLLDLPGDEDWWVIRQMGADAGWSRRYNWDGHGGMAHFHLVLRGCPHNEPARYQYDSPYYGVDHGHNGLANGGLDDGPRPLSGRTWRQGIEWARQQEDDMADPKVLEQLDRIEQAAKAAEQAAERGTEMLAAQRKRQREQTTRLRARLDKLRETGATKAQVAELASDVDQILAATDE